MGFELILCIPCSKERDEQLQQESAHTQELLSSILAAKQMMKDFYICVTDSIYMRREQVDMSQEELNSVQTEINAVNNTFSGNRNNTAWKLKVLNAARIQNKTLEHDIHELETEIEQMHQRKY
jgi:septal ring factor EnvC (AmiA/AmiB activator)